MKYFALGFFVACLVFGFTKVAATLILLLLGFVAIMVYQTNKDLAQYEKELFAEARQKASRAHASKNERKVN